MDVIDIPSPTVSRRHARIVVGDAEVLLEDLGSKNGTFASGKALSGAAPATWPTTSRPTDGPHDGPQTRTGSDMSG
ncbi:MAG TPA: FHA domain-containing protein [Vicinamibacterales bacterium]|nr:FHA domain-containing protein [Vicinamibacterales bacterium]